MNLLSFITGILILAVSLLSLCAYASYPFKTTIINMRGSSGELEVGQWAIRLASISLIALGFYSGAMYVWYPHLAPIPIG